MIQTAFIIILSALSFTACMEPTAPTPNVKNMTDVHYEQKNNELVLVKTHQLDKNTTLTRQEAIAKLTEKPPYEEVPLFDKDESNKDIHTKAKNKKRQKIKVSGKDAKVSVEKIPVNEFIQLVFGNVLELNYTLSDEVSKMTNPITLNMPQAQSKQSLYDVVERLLLAQNITIEKDSGVLFFSKGNSTPVDEETGSYISFGKSIGKNVLNEEKVTIFVPFEYINPRVAQDIVIRSEIKDVRFFYPKNFILGMTGPAANIRKALDIINVLDTSYMNSKTPYLLNLKNILADDFAKELTGIMEANAIAIAQNMNDLGIIIRPIPEINSVLVLTPNEKWLDMVLYWQKKLDVEQNFVDAPRLYIYKVQSRKAQELAEVLSNMLNSLSRNSQQKENQKTPSKAATQSNAKTPKAQANKTQTQRVASNIAFDLPTNTLLMWILPSEYESIKPIIRELDILPLQVLLEVTIAEVTLTDDMSLGFDYAMKSRGIAAESQNALNISGTGIEYLYNSSKLNVAINAFAQNQVLDIISRPKMVVLNNETASMNVGTQIPVVKSETSAIDVGGITPSINRNITYTNTGVQVGITPVINSDGILTMNINLNLSEAQINGTSGIDSPLIVTRSLQTSVVMQSDQTILLGGLISKNKSTTDSGVPYLKDIPFIGNAFASQSEKKVKTELIMMIRPVIIHTPQEMHDGTQKYKSLLKNLKEL